MVFGPLLYLSFSHYYLL